MNEPELLVEQNENIVIATLNRPEKLNALTYGMIQGLRAAVEEYSQRDDLRCFLIKGNGRYFCAGADLVGPNNAAPPQGSGTSKVRQWYRTTMGGGMQHLYNEMELVEKPFVIAHHAMCVGGGLELSLSCDFRLASQSAKYLFPEAKLGAIPASNGVSRLTHLIGPHWSKYMILAGRALDAKRALQAGLVHEVFSDESFSEEVLEFCRDLANQPPEMIAMGKLAIDLAADSTPSNAKRVERLGQSVLQAGEESAMLIQAMKARLTQKK